MALWADRDLSASAIARRLGVSRNAVLGKIHRLGLSNRGSAPAQKPSRNPGARPIRRAAGRRQRPTAAATSVRIDPTAAAPVDLGPGLVARLEDLPRQACHWPVGDPASADFRFCGRPAAHAPYCEDHRRAAHRPRGPRPLAARVRRWGRA